MVLFIFFIIANPWATRHTRLLRNRSESSRLREEHDERLESLHKEVKDKVGDFEPFRGRKLCTSCKPYVGVGVCMYDVAEIRSAATAGNKCHMSHCHCRSKGDTITLSMFN